MRIDRIERVSEKRRTTVQYEVVLKVITTLKRNVQTEGHVQ